MKEGLPSSVAPWDRWHPCRQLRDIAGVLKISGEHLDRSYIKEWAERMGTAEVWEEILKRGG